ncbi:hypothetical protein PV10_01753 [Exophiala mesophila]|uniref:CAP-Gly domain-containing protein n=1 Tax=Exophiala mesophila TaxID=212818 RepID=A0A0D2AGM2_EXOME|nr:uncharacterized protein PV10_01753 [Exophiala mesophila]KIV98063.1 hypothetical protein PV10_01753 [Exophiala mesophila]
MPDLIPRIGQTIETQDKRVGIIRYIGPLHIAAGEWLGLELSDNTGKNDGSVKGERYFDCSPGYGIFVRKESAVKIVKQPQTQPTKPNGSTVTPSLSKSRPSSIVAPDAAKKRQSLMSGGSGTTAGSRLSLKSPTKPPAKPAPPSVSSTASTPRTGTPATTARTSDSSSKSRSSIGGRTLMGPPSTTTKSATVSSNRQSIGGPVKQPSQRPTSIQSRQSLVGSRLSLSAKGSGPSSKPEVAHDRRDELRSPSIQEEDSEVQDTQTSGDDHSEPIIPKQDEPPVFPSRSRQDTLTQDSGSGGHEDRARQAHVIKQLETKIRSLQKQRQEDEAKLGEVETLRHQSTRYEGIIQALQKKLKTYQQDHSELQAKYEDAESRAQSGPDRSAEQDSELELAKLDKELAEERAEIIEAELEALKLKCEELELEAEILKEENLELSSVMTPEERAGSGILHVERENERLRQALTILRDMSLEREANIKAENKELQESLDEKALIASKYEETAAKLQRSEEALSHLREQLDAVDSNEEIVESLAAERDHSRGIIENLKRQIQDYEEHLQVTDELEAFHVEEEKRLHHQLNDTESMLNERQRQLQERQKAIEDLEYTLDKFRDVVQVMQDDIAELRRSREITELEAHEMSSKSRAMMDLNLRLQSSAAKTQVKVIDMELGKMQAEQSKLHLEIVQFFVPDTFETDKQPIIGLLSFKRIRAKALLSKTILSEKVRDSPDFALDESAMIFAVTERLNHIANLCDKFVQYMSGCSTESFMKFGGAPFELQPVEQAVTAWVEALRRDELGHGGPEDIQRMAGILEDMSEKLMTQNQETKAAELLASTSMIEMYADNFASQVHLLLKATESKLGPPTETDEESVTFGKKLDQFAIKARTVKYVSGKVIQTLADLRATSMCPGEVSWNLFAEAEQLSESLSDLLRCVTKAACDDLSKLDRSDTLTYSSLTEVMTMAASAHVTAQQASSSRSEDIFITLPRLLQTLQDKVDVLNIKAGDISNAFEFEKSPAPWVLRAKEVKSQKVISQDLQDELTRMKQKIQEQTHRIGDRDRLLEEQQVKIELLESRAKETKARDDGVKAMRTEIEKLQSEKTIAVEGLQALQSEYQTLVRSQELQRAELESLKHDQTASGQGIGSGVVDESVSLRFKAEVDLLKVEIASMEAAIRFLKMENQQLRIPVNEAGMDLAQHSWLDPDLLKPRDSTTPAVRQLQAETKDMFTDLMLLAKKSKPIKLRPKTVSGQKEDGNKISSWRPEAETTLYKVLRQKEDLEQLYESRSDLIERARFLASTTRRRKGAGGVYALPHPLLNVGKLGKNPPGSKPEYGTLEHDHESSVVDGVRIVE